MIVLDAKFLGAPKTSIATKGVQESTSNKIIVATKEGSNIFN